MMPVPHIKPAYRLQYGDACPWGIVRSVTTWTGPRSEPMAVVTTTDGSTHHVNAGTRYDHTGKEVR